MASGGDGKPTGPSKNQYLQQNAKFSQLVYTTKCVVTTLMVVAVMFIITGSVALSYASQVSQFQYVYMDATLTTPCNDGGAGVGPCTVSITLDKDIPGPVYFYYTLDGFHQNHRRYVKDKDDMQMAGLFVAPTADQDPLVNLTKTGTFTAHEDCLYQNSYTVSGPRPEGYTIYYYPCGLVARSRFNDTFRLATADGTVVPWTKSGIAWRSNADSKYKSKDEAWLRSNCYRLGGQDFDFSGFPESLRGFSGTGDPVQSRYDCWQNVEDEPFNVWMRVATGYSFWKLNRIINADLKAGTYTMTIGSNFPTAAFGGKKGFVLSNATPFGGNRTAIGVSYLVVGLMALVAAVAFGVMSLVRERGEKPQIRYPELTIEMQPPKSNKGTCLPETIAVRLHGKEVDADEKRTVVIPPAEGPEAPKFLTNFVSTTKYTLITFVPLNLFLQFHRFSNCYFLVIAALASIPSISPVGGLTFWFPLITVLFLTALKDGMEDYRRYKSDVEENGRVTEVFDLAMGEFTKVPWKDVRVGNFVRVTCDTKDGCSPMIPADLSLLATSAEDGTAFLETANLDGETNLKLREAPEGLHKHLTKVTTNSADGTRSAELQVGALTSLKATLQCSQPDALIYDFNARMEWMGQDVPLNGGSSAGQFLQRSTKLRNTKWCIGVAVYTGKETKIQKNMSEPPNKVSAIERTLNTFIVYIFIFQSLLCISGAVGASIWINLGSTKGAWYLSFPQGISTTFNTTSPASSGFFSFFSFLILLSLLIPISLYVSVEFVKVFIMFQISSDREMYVEEDDMPSRARTSGLCEELGQVSYIFSDKTGTLTQNLMEFKKCSIAGIEYGRGYCEVERAIARRSNRQLPPDPIVPDGLDPGFKFVDERLLFGKWRDEQTSEQIESFLLNLAINHTVQVEYDSPSSTFPLYQAESPDEGAFVTAARNMGFSFTRRMMKDITLTVAPPGGRGAVGEGREETWTILNTNAFDNNRKRTSVIVENENKDLVLLVKGADTSIMPFVDYSTCLYFDETQSHIDRFSDQGLRTLVFAGRSLTREEYDVWNEKFKKASLMSEGREAALRQLASVIEENHTKDGQESALFDAATSFKKELKLHGVTALEDKLQENVGDTIAQLAKAMIKIWVLTGDKLETAINIGYATALLGTEMEPLHRISQDELGVPREDPAKANPLEIALSEAIAIAAERDASKLMKHIMTFQSLPFGETAFAPVYKPVQKAVGAGSGGASGDFGQWEAKLKESLLKERVRQELTRIEIETAKTRKGGHALVIDGPCLRACMEDHLKPTFLKVGVRCKAVVCCRVTPSQKAQVTLLVKDNMPGQITLAIGDGANDVAMIQAAHIGIGIRGKEGQQAVLASDYALPRFCFLERLLLVHGRWSYNRIGTMISYFIYKNISFALTLYWFSFFNGFSAQPLFDDGYQSTYNLVFTSLPVMIFAVLDRDLEPWVVRLKPEVYSTGHFNVRFNAPRFCLFIAGAIVHSLFFFFVTVSVMDTNIADASGSNTGIWASGTAALTCVVATVNLVMGLHTRSWCWLHWLIYVGSVFVWFMFLMIYHAIPLSGWQFFDTSRNLYWLFFSIANTTIYWLTIVVVVAMCVLPIICYLYYKEHYYPGIDDYYRRVVHSPHLYPEENITSVKCDTPGNGGLMELNIMQPVTDMSAIVMHEEVGNFTPRTGGTPIELPGRAGQFGTGEGMYDRIKNFMSRNRQVGGPPTRSDFTPAPGVGRLGSHGGSPNDLSVHREAHF